MDFYQSYIASAEWKAKRESRLQFDGYECQTCESKDNLEVHHRHYRNLGKEEMDDLITLCNECHEAITSVIRRRRYASRVYTLEDTTRVSMPIGERIGQNGVQEFEVSDYGRVTPDFAQRATGESAQQVLKGNQVLDEQKERQDGR